MARNQEKAQSLLNRWLSLTRPEKPKERRPYLASECKSLAEAEKWRFQILKEISAKVLYIQNAGLEEHKIRELNDEINKLIREKGHWERQIRALGGPDYARTAPLITDDAIKTQSGYMYFGAAKNLPGVQELLKPATTEVARKTRYELYKDIDADYYGFRDDEDGLLERLEADAEKKAVNEAIREWNEIQRAKLGDAFKEEEVNKGSPVTLEDTFISHVRVPTREEIEQMLVEKRKQELLKKVQMEL
jgi:pre-mRNA-splicing factor ISY1